MFELRWAQRIQLADSANLEAWGPTYNHGHHYRHASPDTHPDSDWVGR